MKIHRFYVQDIELTHNIWIHKPELIHQWLKVLRFKPNSELVLFDGNSTENLYKIIKINKEEANLESITEFHRSLPKKNIYLFWSLLKKDKNNWVIQKCTELGVTHFIPIIADRSEKTGFNLDRYNKVIVEAAEQCGRSDIPKLREPLNLEVAITQYSEKLSLCFAEKSEDTDNLNIDESRPYGVFIGPEGGWTDSELQLFVQKKVRKLNLHDFTLRAETASLISVSKLIQ